jgi:hypothetical protein
MANKIMMGIVDKNPEPTHINLTCNQRAILSKLPVKIMSAIYYLIQIEH